MDSERLEKLIGDPGQKDEDAVKQLNTKIKLLMDEYRHRFNQICDVRKYNKALFAKSIYFATYYNKRNRDFDEYVGRFFLRDSRRDIDKFAELW